jgi:hypothetical protein
MMTLIEKESALPVMQVISILSLNPQLPHHLASKYIMKNIQEAYDDVEVLQYNVDTIRNSISSILVEHSAKKQLGNLANSKAAWSLREAAKKSSKGTRIKGGDDEDEDEEDDMELQRQERATEQKKWENIKKAQLERSTDHEGFYGELEQSLDGFVTVAAYFGKTIIFEKSV